MSTLGVVAALALGGLAAVAVAVARAMRSPEDHPAAVLLRPRPSGLRRVAFLGASIIHGRVSAPIPQRVRVLMARAGAAIDVVNAGVNGDLAWNALQRAPAVLRCAPTDVVVLVGSNDVMGSLSARDARRYLAAKRLPQLPDAAFYERSLDALLCELQSAPGVRVAVCTLPFLGEDLASAENQRVRAYNALVQQVATRRGVPVLDVYSALVGALEARGGKGRAAPLLGARLLLPILLREVGRCSFGTIGKIFGFKLLSDGIHLSESAADCVAELIAAWLRQAEHGSVEPADLAGRGAP